MNKKILIIIIAIILSTGLIFGGVTLYNNNYSNTAEAKKVSEKFTKLVYTPDKSNEVKALLSANLKEIKKDDDFSVTKGAEQKVESFKYTTSEEVNPKLVVLAGSMVSSQPDAVDAKSGVTNNFSLRMVKEGADSSWKVDMYTIE